MSPTGDAPNPCSLLFSDWRDQSRLEPTDRGCPLGKDQETDGESKAGRTSQTAIRGTVPCAPARQYPATLLTQQNSNSIVGADIFPYSIVGTINSYMVRLPHMPLGINSVVGASIYRTGRTW